jgi:signal transduction histidine kinase
MARAARVRAMTAGAQAPGSFIAASPVAMTASDDLLDLVATGIAHEVRNPLNAVQLNLHILADELRALDPSLSLVTILGRIASEVGQIDRFVSDFLRYARPVRLTREPLHVQGLVADLGAILVGHAARSGVRVEVTGQSSAVVDGDGLQLRQALTNVALNAVEVSSRGGTVVIALADHGATVAIDVHDAGPALPPEATARAFEPFAAWRDGATGLALAIARRIVEAHGGTLVMVPAGGNCAKMRLPAQRRS